MRTNLKFQQKIQLFIIGSSIIIYILALGYISINARKIAYNDAIDKADNYVRETATKLKLLLDTDMSSVKALADAFHIYKNFPKDEWQEIIHDIYYNIYKNNPHIYGLWDSWELNMIDPEWEESYGRISHSFWRENGVIKDIQELRSLNGDSELYLETKSTLIPSVNEPYMDALIEGKSESFLMISLAAPVVENGQYIAVVAFDITLEQLQDIIVKINPFEGSYAFLVSNKGVVAGHPNKDFLNKQIQEVFPDDCENFDVSNNILEGNSFNYISEDKEGVKTYYSYVPIKVAFTNTPWSVAISVPVDVIMARANKNFRIALFIGVIGILLIALIIAIISKNITAALKKGVEFAQNVANGDLTVTFNIDQRDEVGDLATALNQMVNKLREIVENVEASADNIAAASNEMSSSSQHMSQGASEQASSAEEVSSSMEQMVANIQQNTDNAQQTEKISTEASSGIEKVASASQESLNSIRQIAEKITVVNDIAFQTNILALNAAVEAARAGEHGRGFAVVAAEVRKLAERSKIAAAALVALSTQSLRLTEEAGGLMTKIMPDIEKTSKLVQEIAASSIEQNSGAEQVNSAIQQLNQVTQQNAATSEELATSSEELAAQAQQLKENITFFNLGKNKKVSVVKKQTKNKKVNKKPPKSKEQPKIEQKNQKYKALGGVDIKMTDNKNIDDEYEKF